MCRDDATTVALEKERRVGERKVLLEQCQWSGMVSDPAGNGNSDFMYRTCIEFCGNCMQNLVVWYHVDLV